MWLVMRLQRWSDIMIGGSQPVVPMSDSGYPQRWLAVFDTKEQAEAWAAGAPVLEMEKVTP